jgi:hypothetical protein
MTLLMTPGSAQGADPGVTRAVEEHRMRARAVVTNAAAAYGRLDWILEPQTGPKRRSLLPPVCVCVCVCGGAVRTGPSDAGRDATGAPGRGGGGLAVG